MVSVGSPPARCAIYFNGDGSMSPISDRYYIDTIRVEFILRQFKYGMPLEEVCLSLKRQRDGKGEYLACITRNRECELWEQRQFLRSKQFEIRNVYEISVIYVYRYLRAKRENGKKEILGARDTPLVRLHHSPPRYPHIANMIPTHSTLRRRSAVRSRKASVIRRNFKVVTTSGLSSSVLGRRSFSSSCLDPPISRVCAGLSVGLKWAKYNYNCLLYLYAL
ncbi:hypothetical protein M747DRAFT_313066 [Aspergillus niger ATCC 13496]|uniref:Uncharacterized protein n=3 Tax=Aspergillus niger TaxID=5061 RepID=A2QE70_ASPNC|nr:hypothetical protein An02g09620 [Aspergillus niger]RDH23017.1 hypothetical protein M747DRAFT_313066 [Aspergillus niger ATCC 13496]CAK37831.1 hypothetical protein An02g09620 [Aspergillus niger]